MPILRLLGGFIFFFFLNFCLARRSTPFSRCEPTGELGALQTSAGSCVIKSFSDFPVISKREAMKRPFVFPKVKILKSVTQIRCLLSLSLISPPVRLGWGEKKDGILKVFESPATVLFRCGVLYFLFQNKSGQNASIIHLWRCKKQSKTQQEQTASIWRAVANVWLVLGLNSHSSHRREKASASFSS